MVQVGHLQFAQNLGLATQHRGGSVQLNSVFRKKTAKRKSCGRAKWPDMRLFDLRFLVPEPGSFPIQIAFAKEVKNCTSVDRIKVVVTCLVILSNTKLKKPSFPPGGVPLVHESGIQGSQTEESRNSKCLDTLLCPQKVPKAEKIIITDSGG